VSLVDWSRIYVLEDCFIAYTKICILKYDIGNSFGIYRYKIYNWLYETSCLVMFKMYVDKLDREMTNFLFYRVL
jgi:hypothetical protein